MRQKRAVCVSACQGPAGQAMDGADFGPDYQSPSQRLPQAGALARAFTYGTTKEACSSAAPGDAARVTSLVRALALHGVAMLRSHLASPLRPGRGVLIRSVSRRLGSVACVREDASPNEVSVETTF